MYLRKSKVIKKKNPIFSQTTAFTVRHVQKKKISNSLRELLHLLDLLFLFLFFLNSFSFFVVLVWFECGKDLFKSPFFFYSEINFPWFFLHDPSWRFYHSTFFSLNISQQCARSEHYYQNHEAIPSVKNFVEKGKHILHFKMISKNLFK